MTEWLSLSLCKAEEAIIPQKFVNHSCAENMPKLRLRANGGEERATELGTDVQGTFAHECSFKETQPAGCKREHTFH